MTDSFGYERNSKGERVGNHPRGTSRKVNHNKGIMRKHRQKLHDEAVERQKLYDEQQKVTEQAPEATSPVRKTTPGLASKKKSEVHLGVLPKRTQDEGETN